MRKVRCYACGRGYDYDEDAFCPRCGAFNLPGHRENTLRLGEVTADRRDGLSEKGHTGSFLHREFHGEERERLRMGLDRQETPKREGKARNSSAGGKPRMQNPEAKKPSAIVIFIVLTLLLQLLKIISRAIF